MLTKLNYRPTIICLKTFFELKSETAQLIAIFKKSVQLLSLSIGSVNETTELQALCHFSSNHCKLQDIF